MWQEFKWCFMFCLITGIVIFVIGQLLPHSWFQRGDELWFSPFPRERDGKLYDKLNIRHWKDKVPDMSRVFHRMVSKTMPSKATAEDVAKLIRETCVAELAHEALILTGTVCYIKFRSKFSFFLWILWALGNLPYIIIQRYNRPRLVRLHEHLLLKEQNESAHKTAHVSSPRA